VPAVRVAAQPSDDGQVNKSNQGVPKALSLAQVSQRSNLRGRPNSRSLESPAD
jgi:hypothetical protein